MEGLRALVVIAGGVSIIRAYLTFGSVGPQKHNVGAGAGAVRHLTRTTKVNKAKDMGDIIGIDLGEWQARGPGC